ncbi:hypothetical protein [Terrisporobacter sp.]
MIKIKNILKKIGLGLLFVIIIFGIPALLAWIIPMKSKIPNFSDSNDWIGFFGNYLGSILGGLCALVVMYFTRKDTRDIQKENSKIQNKIINQEKENILNDKRTFVSYYKLRSDPFFSDMGDMYKNAVYILDEDTISTERVLRSENTMTYNPQVFPNLATKVKRITDILNCKDFGFWRVKNVGKNPMHKFSLSLNGEWIDSEFNYVEDIEKSYNFPIIEDGQTLIFPLFKIDENIDIYHFRVSNMTLKYDSGLVGTIESNTISIDFNDTQEAHSKINVEILEKETVAEMNVRIPVYRII